MRGNVNRRRLSEKGKRLFRDSTLPEPSLIVLTAHNKRCVRCSVLNTSNDIVSSRQVVVSFFVSLGITISYSLSTGTSENSEPGVSSEKKNVFIETVQEQEEDDDDGWKEY